MHDLPAGYTDHAPAWDDVRRALAAAPRPTVPCNNDLLAANYLDDGERVWLIDYEYSGNNDVCFELGDDSAQPFRSLVAPMCLAHALVVSTGQQLAAAPLPAPAPAARKRKAGR